MSKYQDSVERIVELMESTFTFGGDGIYKTIYSGEPEQIPAFNLPAIIVTETSDTTEAGAFAQDDVTEQITIKVVYNSQDDYSNGTQGGDGKGVDPKNLTETKIRKAINARDPETGHYLSTSIKGALRSLQTPDGTTEVGELIQVEIGIQPRANGLLTSEGHVTFSLKYPVDLDSPV